MTMSEATTTPAGCEYQTDGDCPIDMSHALIMEFVRGLEEEAARNEGRLDVAALRARADAFLARHRSAAQPPEFCLRLHNALVWDERRRHPFERLLVKRFAHLLPARSGDDGVHDGAVLSRRLIPGLMVAVVTMIGFDAYHEAEERTRVHVARLRAAGALPVDWESVAHQPDIVLLMDKVLATIAGHFEHFDKRVQWLISVINSHLGPRPPEDGSMVWAMGPRKAVALLGALYREPRRRLRDNPAGLEAEVGPNGMAALIALHAALNAAEERAG
ncbi:MAG: hypothetical protein VR70_09220 [Rhodospirillaceae bacterium BRH_c57]|nr:MAG: hypothetical protein VR70_09220 [Rhodospirillaceae bacterium BRH_c57]